MTYYVINIKNGVCQKSQSRTEVVGVVQCSTGMGGLLKHWGLLVKE